MNARGAVAVTIAVVGGLGLVACGDSGSDDTVGTTLTDFEVTADAVTAKAGETTFAIDNDAEQVHEFVVVKTDLAAADLPLDEDGLVDERGEGLTFVDEVEDLQGGESAQLTVDLTPGTYILLCNLPDHFAQGMHTGFTVT
jgi:uncharacterized cupredoxin-like copper-binding protein